MLAPGLLGIVSRDHKDHECHPVGREHGRARPGAIVARTCKKRLTWAVGCIFGCMQQRHYYSWLMLLFGNSVSKYALSLAELSEVVLDIWCVLEVLLKTLPLHTTHTRHRGCAAVPP